jgi:hypothetical protein
MCCRRLRVARGARAALDSGAVLRALLDALVDAEGPAMCAITLAGLHGGSGAGNALALDNLVCALSEALNVFPRTVARLAAAPQRDAVLRCLAQLHAPLRARAGTRSSLAQLHSSASSVLQSLTGREGGAALLFTCMQDTVHALVASLAAQVRAFPPKRKNHFHGVVCAR